MNTGGSCLKFYHQILRLPSFTRTENPPTYPAQNSLCEFSGSGSVGFASFWVFRIRICNYLYRSGSPSFYVLRLLIDLLSLKTGHWRKEQDSIRKPIASTDLRIQIRIRRKMSRNRNTDPYEWGTADLLWVWMVFRQSRVQITPGSPSGPLRCVSSKRKKPRGPQCTRTMSKV